MPVIDIHTVPTRVTGCRCLAWLATAFSVALILALAVATIYAIALATRPDDAPTNGTAHTMRVS